eukprot:Em0008g689a
MPRIRDILVETCRRAHIGVKVEVGNNLSRDHSKTRPADILLPNWFLGRTAALDVSITSPLNPVTLLEAGVSATAAAQATEARKHQANNLKCSELGWYTTQGVRIACRVMSEGYYTALLKSSTKTETKLELVALNNQEGH